MKQLLKKLWHDPVWSKVIAGIFLATGAIISAYFLDWLPSIGSFFARLYQFLLSSTSFPNWMLLSLGLLSLPTLLLLGFGLWKTVFPTKSSQSSWYDYTTDTYFGLRWRWKYYDNGNIYNAHTFCPHCDFQVYAENTSSYGGIYCVAFKCDSCGRYLGEFQETLDTLENKIKRFIQQKIRNGSWINKLDG